MTARLAKVVVWFWVGWPLAAGHAQPAGRRRGPYAGEAQGLGGRNNGNHKSGSGRCRAGRLVCEHPSCWLDNGHGFGGWVVGRDIDGVGHGLTKHKG